ncbi:MAG: hypothetical protein ACFFE6_05065 [Candidatus Thorarchaeota archaeon]
MSLILKLWNQKKLKLHLNKKSNQGRTILPSLLITTSRKTSNRVRSFVRDLWTVLPNTERFNRGGTGRSEISARVRQTGANAALIISMWKGNPSILSFISSTEDELASIKIEMAMLRREVNKTRPRIKGVIGVFIESNSNHKTRSLGELLSSFLNLELVEVSQLDKISQEPSQSIIWLQDAPSGKVLWTHYLTKDVVEIGPRIRVTSLRGDKNDAL